MKDDKRIILSEDPFVSIQGEGASMGRKSVFIRFKGCNLACEWCDSKFTWSGNKAEEPLSFLISDFVDHYRELLMGHGPQNIIFTGGEPTLYQDEIMRIIMELENIEPACITENSYEIETNGTVTLLAPFVKFMGDRRTLINFSPKAAYPVSVQKVIENIENWDGNAMIVKFVDDRKPETRKFIEDTVAELNDRSLLWGSNAYVMPECITRQEHIENFQTTLEYCFQHDFEFSPRLHILLWDKKRGV